MRRTLCAVLFAAAVFTTSAVSQQPTKRQVDSLAAQVRQLRAKLDSLLHVLGRQPAAPAAAAPVGDDLAALRAAASQAAGRGLSDTTRAADTLTQAVGRERERLGAVREQRETYVSAAPAQLLAAQSFDIYADRRYGALWHRSGLGVAHQGRRARVPAHVAAAAACDVPRMDTARRAARAAETGCRHRADAPRRLRQLDLQAEPALHPWCSLRLRRVPGFRGDHETVRPLAHAVAERVGF